MTRAKDYSAIFGREAFEERLAKGKDSVIQITTKIEREKTMRAEIDVMSIESILASCKGSKNDKMDKVCIEASDGNVFLNYNSELIDVRAEIKGTVFEDGETVVDNKTIRDVVKTIKSGRAEIETVENSLVINADSSTIKLATGTKGSVRKIEDFNYDDYHTINYEGFRNAILNTVFAADNANAKYALGTVCVEFVGDKIEFVSTDGRRLANVSESAMESGIHSKEGSFLVPLYSANLIAGIKGYDEVDIHSETSSMTLRFGNNTYRVRLQEGLFPKWRRIIPEKEERECVRFKAGDMREALDKAAVIALKTDKNGSRTDISFKENAIEVSASNEYGNVSSVLVPKRGAEQNVRTKLNLNYILDFVSRCPREGEVTGYIREDSSQYFVQGNKKYVVMPIS